MTLTFQDVEKLAAATSSKDRIDVAGKVAENFARGLMNGREKDVAIEIFRLLARDAEVKVRRILGVQLRACKDLPPDIAMTLAKDEDIVAAPMLEYSSVLEEADLIAIIRSSRRTAKLAAIARREQVSSRVSGLLLEACDPVVSTTLFRNRGAEIPEEGLLNTINLMASEESVIDALVERGGLPLSCVEKIFTSVSVEMKRRLAAQYHVSRHLIEGKMEYAREWATLGTIASAEDQNVEELVRGMLEQRKLTSSIVVRSLCTGDLRFFEHSMAALAGVPVTNARELMRDFGEGGFQSLYRQSPLPPAYYPAVKKLLDVTFEATDNGKSVPANFSKQIVDGITSRGYDKSVEYMPLLLAIIQGSANELTSVH